MRNLPIYILPEHIWKNVSEKEVESYANEPKDGKPIVGAGPYLLAERKTDQFLRLVANPTSYTGAPARRRGHHPGLQNSPDDHGPGAEEGRDRLRRGPDGQRQKSLENVAQHHGQPRQVPRLRRDRVQHGRGHRHGPPDR